MPDLDAFRRAYTDWSRRYCAELFEFWSGQKTSLDLADINIDHAEWFTAERVLAWEKAWRSRGDDHAHALRRGLLWSVRGYLDLAAEDLTEHIAEREAQLTVDWDDEPRTVSEAEVLLAREVEPERRRQLYDRIEDALGTLDPLREERLHTRHAAARACGYTDYVHLHEAVLGIDLVGFLARVERILAATELPYVTLLERFLRQHADTTPLEATAADAPFLRAFALPGSGFPADRLTEAFDCTLNGLGLAPLAELPISLDLEARPTKRPRAFCVTLDVPHDVRVSHLPRGGPEDYVVTFHELGHALHFAHMDELLPPEDRYWGDRGLMETYASLMEAFVGYPDWLETVMGLADPDPVLEHRRLVKLWLVRRYVAKLQYELELHRLAPGADLDDARETYARRMSEATRLPVDTRPALRDFDDGFYCVDYLRAWCLDAQVRRRLADQFGPRWFMDPTVGALFQSWWGQGNAWSADDLGAAAGVGVIRPDTLIAELGGLS